MFLIDINELKFYRYPAGELGINIEENMEKKIQNFNEDILLEIRIKSSDDIMKLLIITDYIRKVKVGQTYSLALELPYIPYAREDRFDTCRPFSLKTFANIINAQKYDEVICYDPHSNVCDALFDNLVIYDKKFIFEDNDLTKLMEKYDLVVCPDAGAMKSIFPVAKMLNLPVVCFDKMRDAQTGEILGVNCACDNFKDRNCLIIDDIIDGGRTFIEIAKYLKEREVGSVGLYVTHAIFSKGVDVCKEYIDEIFTTNTFNKDLKSDDYLTVIKVY